MKFEPSRRVCEGILWWILFFGPASFGATEWWSSAALECAIFVLAGMCALRADFSASLSGPLAGFAAIPLLGAAQCLFPHPLSYPAGWLPWTVARPQTLYALLRWTSWTALLWSASGVLRWPGAFERLSRIVLGVGAFIALAGILQRGQGDVAYYGLRPIAAGRPFGPFTNADHAATWLAAAAFIGIGIFLFGFSRRLRLPPTERAAKQVLVLFILVLLSIGIVQTQSRGAGNALAASTLAFAWVFSGSLSGARLRRGIRAIAILAAGAYVYVLFSHSKWVGVSHGALDLSTAYRLSMYRSGLRMLADFPLFGVGLGGFAVAFHAYQEPLVVGLVTHVHGSWLEIALETGLFGLAAFLWSTALPLERLRRVAERESPRSWLAAGWFGALLVFLIHGLVEFSFQIPADAALFVVLMAAGAGGPALSEEIAPTRSLRRFATAALFIFLAGSSLLIGFPRGIPRLGAPYESYQETLPAGLL